MNDEQRLAVVKEHIGEFPDFPKKGIVFKDIFTALTNGHVCTCLKELIVNHVRSKCPDVEVIVGLESRGFLFSFTIAAELGIGCVPVRKKGKLPGECVSVEYVLEYGKDVFEMQKDSIKKGQKVLIIDDLLATGGSMEAAVRLVRKLGGEVQEALVLIELPFLNGRKRLDCNVHSFIQY
ncbi:unnamed protein product [Hermetia illucens]|uniref:Adenine phosphoribosyltransferase n=1 Tax=Hermetia illucens TaxID=343691 RepID=A0A7R8UJZ3_HERIL|nr:adenine phosphoribosyltransferase [Hermetia illucens]CAD7081927.1 unnamed protein product [Hermetia illucens]